MTSITSHIGILKHPQHSRDISFVEKYFFWRTQLDFYTNVGILAEYSTTITPEKLYQALTNMLYKYSALTMTLVPDKDNLELGYHFNIADSIKLSDIAEFINDDSFENNPELILNTFKNEKFIYGTTKQLWRLKIINSKYVHFYFDHILFDGTSGKNFHIKLSNELEKEILPIVSDQFNGLNSIIFDRSLVDDTFKVSPKPNEIIYYGGSFGSAIYKLLVGLFPKNLGRLLKYWFSGSPYYNIMNYDIISFKDIKINSEKENSCKIINLSSTQLDSLIKLSRSHNVKLTSLMVILSHMSAGKYIANTGKDTVTSVPVNIRNIINEKHAKSLDKHYTSLFGLYMSFVAIDLPVITKLCPNDEINWSVVQYVHQYIHKFAKDSPLDLGLLKYINVKRYISRKYKDEEMPSLELSNVGMIGSEHKNIVNAWFDQPSQLFSVNMISTQNGGTMVLRVKNTEWVDGFKDGLEKLILSLIPQTD